MKRDDMGVRIDEIRKLATEHNKADLQRMVQLGLIEPGKAVMAGMMIDRIAKSAMTAPQTTVAQDVLGQQQPPAMPPQGVPQGMPPQGMPQQPVMAADGGMMGLPVGNVGNYAGGGIVAFADGGDTYAVPGYAEGILTNSRNDPAMRIDPRVQATRDKDRYTILAEELRDAQKRLSAGDPRAAGDIEALRREMRSVKPAPSAESGLTTLIPSAQAAEVAKPVPEQQSGARPKTSRERLMEQQVLEEYGIGPQNLTEAQQKASVQSAAKAAERTKLQEQLRNIEGSFFDQKPMTQAQSEEAARLRNEIDSISKLPPISPPAKPAAVETPPVVTPSTIAAAQSKEEKAVSGPPRPGMMDRLSTVDIDVPEKKELSQFLAEQDAADTAMGVDKTLFDKLRADYKEVKGSLKSKTDKAANNAIMMFGLGLIGARRGQEFQTASQAGQQALMMYMSNMDKISDKEDKITQAERDLRIAEDQYKRSRSDKALSRMETYQNKIDAYTLKKAELENAAKIKAAEFNVDLIKNKNPPQWQLIQNLAEESGKSPVDIFLMANGIAKSGTLTFGQALEAVQRNPMMMGKNIEEQMAAAQRMVGGSGGGARPMTQEEVNKLPKGSQYLAPDGTTRTKQ